MFFRIFAFSAECHPHFVSVGPCMAWQLVSRSFFGCAMDAVLFSSTAEPGFNDEKPECSPARESWHRNVDLDEILYRMIMDDLRHSTWHVARCLLRKNAIFVWMDSIV